MVHTFEELVAMRRAAGQAHNRVEELRDQYGPPAHNPWTKAQTDTYETAWRSWRDLARDLQAAVTEYAKAHGELRADVEEALKKAARQPEEPA